MKCIRWCALALLCLAAFCPALPAQVSVWTQHNDNARTGANLHETQLNTSNVTAGSFGKLFSLSVDAAIYSQPLYVSHISILGKGVHNVIYVATMNDSVYAFDADAPAPPLWTVNYTNPAAGVTAVPAADVQNSMNISGTIGIEGTPVIDLNSATMYLLARTKESGAYVQRLHAVDITSGAERAGGPVVIQASVAGSGYDSSAGMVTFDPKRQNQRPALALVGGNVYIAWSSHNDTDHYHGWLIGYDASTLHQSAVFNDTPDGGRGGIWQSGQAPAADSQGNLYLMTGNGDWNGARNFGETFLKLSTQGTLAVSDWFTPDSWAALNTADQDVGSTGALLIPNTTLLAGGTKQGKMYLVNASNMGHEQTGNPQVQTLSVSGGPVKGSPVYWESPVLGPLIYVWGDGDHLKAYHFNGTALDATPLMQSSFAAPGDPAGLLAVSAHGSMAGTGIVWASLPLSGSAVSQVVPGMLHAFDASNLANELWNSQRNPARDAAGSLAKFVPPTIANGKVYLASFSNALNVYGLLKATADFAISGSPYSQAVTAGESTSFTLTVTPLNGFNGSVTFTVAGLPFGTSAAFNPSSVTGEGTVQMSVTAAGAPADVYPFTVTAASGGLTHTWTGALVFNANGAWLSGSVTTPAGAQDLTALGTADWIAWGLPALERKANVAPQIGGYSIVGFGSPFSYTNNPFGFSWTDGAPDASVTDTTTGLYISGLGNGFNITAPADTTTRSLTVYVGASVAQGKMVAHLSDGSSPDFLDTSLESATGTAPGAYTFLYSAGGTGQTLSVAFTQNDSDGGNVTLEAAALALKFNINDSGTFVNQLYEDLLGRPADPSGLAYWTGQLTGGQASRSQVAQALIQSPEVQADALYIIEAYIAALDRDPDYAGWDFWLTQIEAGVSQQQILDGFAGTPEYEAIYGSLSPTGFVDLLYQNLLGRPADPGGEAYWVGQITSGGRTELQVMYAFLTSPEFVSAVNARALANLMYLGFLRRSADPAGLAYWEGQIAAGEPLADVINAFITSPEYYARF